MHRLRTVTYLDVSAVAGHYAMLAALLFALGRGPYMGPEYVGTKILADFGSAIMWSSILH